MDQISVKGPFKKLAQMGYGARGMVYLVIGGLALMAALGNGGKTTGSKGAINTILQQPLGNTLLVLLVIGLMGYVLWRAVQAIKDTDDHGHSGKGLLVRGGLLISAISHAVLAVWTVSLMLGEESSSGGGSPSWLSSTPGLIVLVIAGLAMIGVGFAHMFKGWTARFERYMDIPASQRYWARPLCRFGLIARGIVWCIVGGVLINATLLTHDAEIKGVSDALNLIAGNAFGTILLAITAAGLMAFGAYSLLEARYRRIDASAAQDLV